MNSISFFCNDPCATQLSPLGSSTSCPTQASVPKSHADIIVPYCRPCDKPKGCGKHDGDVSDGHHQKYEEAITLPRAYGHDPYPSRRVRPTPDQHAFPPCLRPPCNGDDPVNRLHDDLWRIDSASSIIVRTSAPAAPPLPKKEANRRAHMSSRHPERRLAPNHAPLPGPIRYEPEPNPLQPCTLNAPGYAHPVVNIGSEEELWLHGYFFMDLVGLRNYPSKKGRLWTEVKVNGITRMKTKPANAPDAQWNCKLKGTLAGWIKHVDIVVFHDPHARKKSSGWSLTDEGSAHFSRPHEEGRVRFPARVLRSFMSRRCRNVWTSMTKYLESDPTPATPFALEKNGSFTNIDLILDLDFTLATNANLYGPTLPVEFSFFGPKKGNFVTLYQDAHVGPAEQQRLGLANIHTVAGPHVAPNCWEDVSAALNGAQRFIYITGWAIDLTQTLLRPASKFGGPGYETLGDLLIRRANEGVKVCILQWNELLSGPLLMNGLMSTHDETNADRFKKTKVHYKKVYRQAFAVHHPGSAGAHVTKSFTVDVTNKFESLARLLFTHHQKTIILDYEPPGGAGGRRGIMAFVGGLDLTDGRYDSPQHPIFKSLHCEHDGDFHNPNLTKVTPGLGPRLPWHDVHGRLCGPVARDVLANFIARWYQQVEQHQHKEVEVGFSREECAAYYLSPQEEQVAASRLARSTFGAGGSTWTCQLLRSIDASSAAMLDPATNIPRKDRPVDSSIHDAYVHCIRRAKRFIYVENQYFLGSSVEWPSFFATEAQPTGCPHMIPKEIVMRIASAIHHNQPFHVYILVPMWPEGPPAAGATQEILHWQFHTMHYMYNHIAERLKEMNSCAHPTDYLTFWTPVNREVTSETCYVPNINIPAKKDSNAARLLQAHRSGRSPIYVHSKYMSVDDDVVICGSANINERSMNGARDSEIAFMAIEDDHCSRGQVFAHRMSLWAEHAGRYDPVFEHPESPACIAAMKAIGAQNWFEYCRPEPTDMSGHLVPYPIIVEQDGHVRPALPGMPDHGPAASIVGIDRKLMPDVLTT